MRAESSSVILRQWHNATKLSDEMAAKVAQVYVWIIDDLDNIIIVSKDGKEWQLPGGKPDRAESLVQTGAREVREETGFNIQKNADQLKLFGYYDLKVDSARILQLRILLKLPRLPMALAPQEPADKDAIRFAKVVNISEVHAYMPWISNSSELSAALSLAGKL